MCTVVSDLACALLTVGTRFESSFVASPGGERNGARMLDTKGTKILAKSLFKELRGSGYTTNQILSLSTELIDLVTQDLKDEHAQAPPPRRPLRRRRRERHASGHVAVAGERARRGGGAERSAPFLFSGNARRKRESRRPGRCVRVPFR